MKINTDGTLLGALSASASPVSILDIGTGTGVIALMLAQRFPTSEVHAVEIEHHAARRALQNFCNSPFGNRLHLHPGSFQQLSTDLPGKKFDLIVSNPPFFINSLRNRDEKKQTARHSDHNFFTELINFIFLHLSDRGVCTLILPLPTVLYVEELLDPRDLYITEVINIRSFDFSEVHRQIITISRNMKTKEQKDFVIYSTQKEYSEEFVKSLKDFFTIF
ncbi:tRNA1(Val) (adenine(37)-N6)-methyltransferase [Desertivirga arenae]|uniref:tRNA1(Val) (adenine(37)-N6)-methyltransferase n=1 Tax=Desertivirga arenae TaxID=2810309 RepID=UPI001A96600E|nr:methyltransferase [Pedobacter sp. SYSU D00823]